MPCATACLTTDSAVFSICSQVACSPPPPFRPSVQWPARWMGLARPRAPLIYSSPKSGLGAVTLGIDSVCFTRHGCVCSASLL